MLDTGIKDKIIIYVSYLINDGQNIKKYKKNLFYF